MKYQGKVATFADIEFIKKLIAENPGDSRHALSKKLCKAWNWVQSNGYPCDMVCRGYMLKLHREGYITLPPKKSFPPNPLAERKAPPRIKIDREQICKPLSEVRPINIRQVRGASEEPLFNSLIEQFHYLGYSHPVGEHLKYLVYTQEKPVACLSWSSAVRHLSSRDKFIGWPPDIRRRNLHLIAYNSRFLIFDWIRIPFLASHILGEISKRLPLDWERAYNHPVYFLETFIDMERFTGTCYKAANWIFLGETTGRGKNDQTNTPNRSIKAVWGYPLTKHFREVLRHE